VKVHAAYTLTPYGQDMTRLGTSSRPRRRPGLPSFASSSAADLARFKPAGLCGACRGRSRKNSPDPTQLAWRLDRLSARGPQTQAFRLTFVLLAALAIPSPWPPAARRKTKGVEGEYINAGDALYQVQLSRLLNSEQRPDDDYLRGQPT
jgi:hypothetical protein